MSSQSWRGATFRRYGYGHLGRHHTLTEGIGDAIVRSTKLI